jgi:hypothetical protein
MAGGWKNIHNEELRKLRASQNTFRVITSRRMRWAAHIARVGEMRNVYEISVGEPKWKKTWENSRI